MQKLSVVTNALKKEGILTLSPSQPDSINIDAITYDSKQADKNTLFICKGKAFKEQYLKEAVENGCVCYLADKLYDVNIPYVIVSDIRKALAVSAEAFYEYDKNTMKMCCVTGTKGKSSTTYFFTSIMKEAQNKCAYTTTVQTFDGKELKLAVLTTPESADLHRIIRNARINGCSHMIMEASSMAEKMQRTYNMHFDIGVFLNISADHISPFEHKSFEEYLSYKLKILKRCKSVAVNIDDEQADNILNELHLQGIETITFSLANTAADVYMKSVKKSGFKRIVCIHTPKYEIETEIRMPGEYNLYNALGAVCMAYLCQTDKKAIIGGLENTFIPGRMEKISIGEYTVIVDYAHNKTSMNAALRAISEDYPDKKIKVIFGCSGGKVPKRREDMAYEASQKAVYAYITNDNPTLDSAIDIAQEIQSFANKYGLPNEIILDRADAVKQAVMDMNSDEIILIAGKGREQFQKINGEKLFYEGDDILSRKYLEEFKSK